LTKIAAAALPALMVAVSACNEESSTLSMDEMPNMAVTAFSLSANTRNPGLDSAYFSIDLERGIIFNADSLRKGTDISKVVAKITYPDVVDRAIITMTGGSVRTGEIDYEKTQTDSIDFTGEVTLTLGIKKFDVEKVYRLKVNVHKEEPDLLAWDEMAFAALPSRLGSPLRQKTVEMKGLAVSLIEENDGTYTLATCDNLYADTWKKHQITLPFKPDTGSLAASGTTLWILDDAGNLYTTTDLETFTPAGEKWLSITGTYLDSAIGIREEEGKRYFAQHPVRDMNQCEIPSDFPVSGTSNFVTLQNKWTSSPVALAACGRKADGKMSDSVWAFDGKEWIILSNGGLPAMEGASLIPYYNYRPSHSGDSMIEYGVWMLLGGRMADGSFNRTIYISYDNGVTWHKGDSKLQLPDVVPSMSGCDNIVAEHPMEGNLSDNWKIARRGNGPRRIGFTTDGDRVLWDCPYIYLIGGQSPDGKLYDTIWRGVLQRLTFMPII